MDRQGIHATQKAIDVVLGLISLNEDGHEILPLHLWPAGEPLCQEVHLVCCCVLLRHDDSTLNLGCWNWVDYLLVFLLEAKRPDQIPNSFPLPNLDVCFCLPFMNYGVVLYFLIKFSGWQGLGTSQQNLGPSAAD